ncbi:hypothetical protein HanRHA438_Chr16g0738201 [Helianthus annuus]|nr:hypothetical protein HanLR1_Chr16g0602701 [Helianthus annuus]KAJ0643311.1 hypothetical protein HanOQP8_Chr16g0599211 [Helianthus annuus]KAJ0680143.1 hypothetical protein HanPI659440_Chr16g0621011 [Helianthus annuus]KAJ0833940.1 hypothetical protein HanRHA438_Chr16g0738201 [Helianthus annuus]
MATKSLSSNSYSFSKMNIDEDEWVEYMRKSMVEHDDEIIGKIPVCIFTVPQVLLATDPESYIPQQVALGPFHHWRPEVYDMQRYKLAAARRIQKHMNVSFEQIVEIMKKDYEARIRACYHKFLDMSADALVWMMAVDMAFLLELLQVYAMKEEGRVLEKVTSSMSHVVDVTGKKLSHMAILRDVVMVENQIPLFLIRTMMEHQLRKLTRGQVKSADETLKMMLMGLYQELTPFHEQQLPDVDINDCDHLLDFLYHMTVPNNEELVIMEAEIDIENEQITELPDGGEKEEETFAKKSEVRKVMNYIWNLLLKSNVGFVRLFKKLIFGRPMTLLMKLPWKIISNLPPLKLMKEPMERMLEKFNSEGEEKEEDASGEPKAPTIEEIKIPSVMELVKAGILFSPVNGGILDMSFDNITSTLYLPVIVLDVNTEVYLRNLVAYEACVAAGPLVLARYTELMNGIIDTEDDAKYLRERGIVLNHLKSDKEAADLWNGMSKCVKLTKVPKMDKVIEDVNTRYSKTWPVKIANFMNTYVFGSWKFLTIFAALFMLLLTGLQSFCSVYTCSRIFHTLPDI